jgi:drug/metabolite transporter (DMT)-like permease
LKRRFHGLFLITACLAVVGAGIVFFKEIDRGGLVQGFLLLQVANLCFAFGQVAYKHVMDQKLDVKDHHVFGFLYAGAVVLAALFALFSTDWSALDVDFKAGATLLYLGVLASGICFFLWNLGARRTNAGTLAVFNNLKAPLAVAVSLLVFREEGDITNLLLGGALILAALFFNEGVLRKAG